MRGGVTFAAVVVCLAACAPKPKSVGSSATLPSVPSTAVDTTTALPTIRPAIVQVRTSLPQRSAETLTNQATCRRDGQNLMIQGQAPNGTQLVMEFASLAAGSFPMPGAAPKPHLVSFTLTVNGKQLTAPADGSLLLDIGNGARGSVMASKFEKQPATVTARVSWQCI